MKKCIVGLAILVISISLVAGCASITNSPVITSLKADAVILSPSGSTQITSTAWARDGGSLSYNWSASGGNLSSQLVSGGSSTVWWKAPDEGSKYTITARVIDSNGNQDVGDIVLTVSHPPTIESLVTDAEGNWVKPSGSVRIECRAEGQDGAKLTYAWQASGGRISGRGPAVTWIAPETVGGYRITVVVTDGKGGEGKRSLSVAVALSCPLGPPVIENLVVTPKEPDYMKGETIFQGKSCELKCLASDPNGYDLSYAWSAGGGQLSGTGPVVVWTAPNNGGTFTVTVTVTDTVGGVVTGDKTFNVVTCTCALH